MLKILIRFDFFLGGDIRRRLFSFLNSKTLSPKSDDHSTYEQKDENSSENRNNENSLSIGLGGLSGLVTWL